MSTTAEIKVTKGDEVEKQIKMLGLTEAYLHLIHSLQPYVTETIEEMVKNCKKNSLKSAQAVGRCLSFIIFIIILPQNVQWFTR
ncbi:hypothetical protein FN924_03340 [Radiobacillus deserti]|uniref:Uncharacterized protein n=1 Tax=Radiobacillus deserti TaxID=2594883 RepID=A0A516KD36_9BACI|nr:hypothetical protein FN924_03340 [Radiobacillus deserti]